VTGYHLALHTSQFSSSNLIGCAVFLVDCKCLLVVIDKIAILCLKLLLIIKEAMYEDG